jgi:thiosulfate/3-mercaptopyruvate sulfurtransferase
MPVVDADGAAELARTGVLLDARAPERYRGEVEPIDPRAGHVPGAINAPFAAHVDADGHWRPASELAEHFAAVGVTRGTVAGVATASAAPEGTSAVAAGDSGAVTGVDGSTAADAGTGTGTDAGAGAATGAGAGSDGGTGASAGSGVASGADAGGSSGTRVGAYCGSGVTATSVLLALEVAGVTSVDNPGVLYAGSWSNWSADPERPVATGSEPR